MKRKLALLLVSMSMVSSVTVPAFAAGWSTGSPATNQQTTQNQSISVSVNNYKPSAYFNDIGGHWAQTYIEKWAANGIFGGMGDGSFKPNNTLTRAQFASVLTQLFDLQMVTENNPKGYKVPSDVTASSWARDAIARCLDNGVMNLRNGSFAPEQPITREEVFFALGTAMNINDVRTNGSSNLNKFIDGNQVSSAARNTISKMVSLGMINGKGNNKLEPQNYITRGEVSTVLSQSVEFRSESSIKNETFDNAVILNVSSKRGDLTVSDVKVNGNLFITGDNIDTIDLESISVSGKVYIYANSIEQINIDDVTDTDFVIVCSDITFEDSNDSDGNNFTFLNANTVEFNGEADSIEIEGDYLEEITVNGNAGDNVESLTITGGSSDEIDITLSGSIKEAEINADADIKGYGRVKTLILDEGDYKSSLVGDTTKVLSGKLKVNGSNYSKGTYYRSEIAGANTPDEKDSNTTTGVYISPSTVTHTTGNTFDTKLYFASNKTISHVTMDNVSINNRDYTINYSNNSLSLKSDYVNSLSVGSHTFKLFYTDGSYSTVSININYNQSKAVVTPRNIYHAKGSIFTTTLTYQSVYNPTAITIDNTTVPTSYCNFDYVNRRISLNSNYVNSLNYGSHTVRIHFAHGSYDDIKLTISDNSLATSFNYDKIAGSAYHRDIVVSGVSAYPTSIYFNSSQLPTSYYTYNSNLQEVTFSTAYLDTFEPGTYTVNINTEYGSKTVSIKISKSSQSSTFVFDKNLVSSDNKDVILSGNISPTGLAVYVGNNTLTGDQYDYSSGSVVIKKSVFSALNTGDYLIRVVSVNGTIEASVTVVDTTATSQVLTWSKGNNSSLMISSPYSGVINKVEFAGNQLATDVYSSNVDGNMVTISKDYLKTYSNQSYNLEISYTNGNKVLHTVVVMN